MMKRAVFLLFFTVIGVSHAAFEPAAVTAARIEKLESDLATLKAQVTKSQSLLSSQVQYDNVLIKGRSAPGVLRISDNFGKETPIFSIGGDLAMKMFSDPARQIVGSMVIQNNIGEDVFRFKQDGGIRYTKIPELHATDINDGKDYYLPVLDETGTQAFIRVKGSWLSGILGAFRVSATK